MKKSDIDLDAMRLPSLLMSIDELVNWISEGKDSLDDLWYRVRAELNNKSPDEIVKGRDVNELKMLEKFLLEAKELKDRNDSLTAKNLSRIDQLSDQIFHSKEERLEFWTIPQKRLKGKTPHDVCWEKVPEEVTILKDYLFEILMLKVNSTH